MKHKPTKCEQDWMSENATTSDGTIYFLCVLTIIIIVIAIAASYFDLTLVGLVG